MTEASKPVLTGGCQCGAVRFAISATPNRVSICHCRMCQKASGAPFASFADINRTDFAWTKGQPSFFRSSSIADRGYCAACGTPLSFGRIDGERIEIMTGAFDRPDRAGADAAIRNRIPPRLGGRHRQPAEPDHAAELRTGEDGDHRQPSASGS